MPTFVEITPRHKGRGIEHGDHWRGKILWHRQTQLDGGVNQSELFTGKSVKNHHQRHVFIPGRLPFGCCGSEDNWTFY